MYLTCKKTNSKTPLFRLFFFLFMAAQISLFSIFFPHKALAQTPADTGHEWGIRPYAEELVRYTALTKQLEKDTSIFEQRYTNASDKLSQYLAGMTPKEQGKLKKAFKARKIAGSMHGGRLKFYKEASLWTKEDVRNLPDIDVSGDDFVSMSARWQAWGTRIRYLKEYKEYLRYQAIIEEEKAQFFQSHMTNSLSHFLGMDLEFFLDDLIDDFKYIILDHAQNFFGDLCKCAAKEVTHIVKKLIVFPGRYSASQRPLPTIETLGSVSGIGSGAVTCLTDAARDSLVRAMENAIRKNFIDDMKDEGIPSLIAEYWWSKYVLKKEKPEANDPTAPRTRSIKAAFADTINDTIENMSSIVFKNKQVKKSLVDEYDHLIRRQARDEAGRQLKAYHRKLLREGAWSPAKAQRFRTQSADRVRKIADRKLKKSTRIKFLEHLDWGIMLLQQGIMYKVRSGQVADFKKCAAPLIKEYQRICTCLDKEGLINADHTVLGIYRMGLKQQKDFFSQCDATEMDEHLILSRRLIREMKTEHSNILKAIATLSQTCPEGAALTKTTMATMESIKSLTTPLLNDMKKAASRLPEAKIALDKLTKAGNESADLGLKVVEAKHEAENEAGRACRAKAGFNASTDAQARKRAVQKGEEAVSKARDAIFRAKQAYGQAAALRDRTLGDYSTSTSAIVKDLTALTGRLAQIRGKIAQAQVSEGRLNQMATKAKRAWYALNGAHNRTKALLKEASVLADSNKPEINKIYSQIRKLGGIIVGSSKGSGKKTTGLGMGYVQCPMNMRSHADKLALELNTLKLNEAALKEAEASLPENTVFSSIKERYDQAAADIVSAVDVAEIFAQAAGSAVTQAEDCLNFVLAQDQEIKNKDATEKNEAETDDDLPAFVKNSGDVDEDVPAFVKNSGPDPAQDTSAKVTHSTPAASTPASVNRTVKTTSKKNSVSNLYKTKTGWRDNIVDQSVKMDEKTKKTFTKTVVGKTKKKPDEKISGSGLLGVEFNNTHSSGND